MKSNELNEYFMNIAHAVKNQSTCLRRQVGAIIVKDSVVISTGFNSSPDNIPKCETCIRSELNIPSGQKHEICMAVHAEQNAIVHAAKLGIPIDGSELYVTTQPCVICAKLIINSGIKRVYYTNPYPDSLAMEILDRSFVEVIHIQ